VLRLSAKESGGFVRQWPLPGGQAVNRHRGYALQWFAMALVLVGVFLAMVRRERKSDPEQEPPHD
jgi:surfeit locus 1 family protein